MEKSLAESYPALAAEWSGKNAPLRPEDVTGGSHRRVWWKGACGHEWQTAVKDRVQYATGCPFCSGKKVLKGFNDLRTRRPDIASQWAAGNEINPDEVTCGSNKIVRWRCSQGHEWMAAIKDRTSGKGCPLLLVEYTMLVMDYLMRWYCRMYFQL